MWPQQLHGGQPGEAHASVQGKPAESSSLAALPILRQACKDLQQRCVPPGWSPFVVVVGGEETPL